jgi:hypothetical protein
MIYLFEDRKKRMDLYLKDKLDSNVISLSSIDCLKVDLENYLKNNFSNADAIIFHSSYIFSDVNITIEDVKKYFSNLRIPFVYFSGGLSNNLVIENGITNGNIDSENMYKNIQPFLKEYNLSKKPNIALLVYGVNYLLNSILELQATTNLFLFNKKNEDVLTTYDINELVDLIDARIKEEELKNDKKVLIDWLSNEKGIKKIKKKLLIDQIQKFSNKY